jgi:hypothetical protein
MAHIGDLVLSCYISDVVYLGWSVNFTHLLEAEFPEISLFVIGVIFSMLTAILATSLVPHPHIIPFSSKLESGGNGMLIYDPAVG